MQLHNGVLAHAAARRLDHAGYKYEQDLIGDIDGEPVAVDSQPCGPCLVPATGAVLALPMKPTDGESMSSKVEKSDVAKLVYRMKIKEPCIQFIMLLEVNFRSG